MSVNKDYATHPTEDNKYILRKLIAKYLLLAFVTKELYIGNKDD